MGFIHDISVNILDFIFTKGKQFFKKVRHSCQRNTMYTVVNVVRYDLYGNDKDIYVSISED